MITKKIVIFVTSGILILVIGVGLGMLIQKRNVVQQVRTESAQILGSKIISSVSAYGKVTKIEGRNITLSNLGDNLLVSMPTNARIYSFTVDPKTNTPVQKIVAFGDIKVGDSVNANLKLLANGQFEGVSVIILPVSSK